MMLNPVIKEIEKMELACISHKGKAENSSATYNTLITWAANHKILSNSSKMVTIYHNSPKNTAPENLEMSACIVLNNTIKTDGMVKLKTIQPTKCIVARAEITPFQFKEAWENLYAYYIKSSYKKSEIDPFEIYYNNAAEHPENKFIVDLCIPILDE